MRTDLREREQTYYAIFLRLFLIMGLYGLLLMLCGCGGSFVPDARMKTSGNIKLYEQRLEERLKQRYNNLPDYAGQISRVDLVLTHRPEHSVDGRDIRVEFSQLVYDKWGRRVPLLEKEYYIVTFGYGTPKLVRTDPSITIGMNTQSDFSENFPADPTQYKPRTLPHQPKAPAREHAPDTPQAIPDKTANDIPVVPPATEDLVPARITRREPAAQDTSQAQPARRKLPSLLRSLAPSRCFRGRLPRNEIRNLPPLEKKVDDPGNPRQ